jgi:hypothetical protein
MSKVVLFYGFPASGKLTMAKQLVARAGFKLLDNHYVFDFFKPFIDMDKAFSDGGIFSIRTEAYNALIKAIIKYGVPDSNYVFTSYLDDSEADRDAYNKKFVQFAKYINADFYPILLNVDIETLCSRAGNPDRKARHGKISSESLLRNVISGKQIIRIDHPNKLVLDAGGEDIDLQTQLVLNHIGC